MAGNFEVTPDRYPISAKLESVRDDAMVILSFLRGLSNRKDSKWGFGEWLKYEQPNFEGSCERCIEGTYISGTHVIDGFNALTDHDYQRAILEHFGIDQDAWSAEQEMIKRDIQIALRIHRTAKARGFKSDDEAVGVTDKWIPPSTKPS